MAKQKGMGLCVMCDKRLTLANTRHQRHFVEPDPEGFCYCDGCQEVNATKVGQVICVYDWRNGCYNEWVVLIAPEFDSLSASWNIQVRQHDTCRSVAPDVHYAHWTGTRWEEGCI